MEFIAEKYSTKCTKQGISSILDPKICGFKSRASYNGACTVSSFPD